MTTWPELLAKWRAEQSAIIDAAVERQDAYFAEIGASAEERARFAAELREALVSGTDLPLLDHPQ